MYQKVVRRGSGPRIASATSVRLSRNFQAIPCLAGQQCRVATAHGVDGQRTVTMTESVSASHE